MEPPCRLGASGAAQSVLAAAQEAIDGPLWLWQCPAAMQLSDGITQHHGAAAGARQVHRCSHTSRPPAPPLPRAQTVVVDCRGHMLGRLASVLAKQLLSGQQIVS